MISYFTPPRKASFMLIVIIFAFAANVVTSSPYVLTYEEAGDNEVIPTTRRPLLGAHKCTRGPAYWCYNITQAKECGAVRHCIGKVWEPMKLPADNDDICDICKKMVKEARDQLLSNETQDELRQVLEGSCKLIPLEIISSECCKLADDFIPELVDALASRMDPQVVCAVSGLCNSARIDEMLGQMKQVEDKTPSFNLAQDSCPKCTHYVGKSIDFLKKLTKTELLHKIFEVCGHMSSYSDSCRAVAIEEIDAIYSHLQNEINAAEVCGLVGLCQVVSIHPVKIEGSGSGVRVWTPPTTHGDYQCDFCKQLVSYVKNWFTTDTTKEEFKEIINGLCKQTGKYKDECLNLANEYGDLVYQLIVEELDPQKACVFIESCNGTSTIQGRVTLFSSASNPTPLWTILHSDVSLTKLQPAEHLTGNDERPSHQPGFSYPMTKLQPAEVMTGDDERPSHQPDFTYPMIELTPAEKRTGNDEMTSSVPKKGVKDILPTCGICTFTVTKLIDLIGGNISKEAIDSAMEKVCDVVPQAYKDECLTLMREYGDKVAEMIILEGSAHGVCMALHLCIFAPAPSQAPSDVKLVGEAMLPYDRYMPQSMVEDELTKSEGVESKPQCALCEFVMTRLEQMLHDNDTEQEIKDTVMQICNYMPKTLKEECRDFIDEYGDSVIEYLSKQMDPKEICTELKFCDGMTLLSDDTKNVMDLEEMDKCELCTLISSYLSAFLDDPKVDTSIDTLVERVCPLLPKGHQTECKELIEDYGPYLLSLLAQATDKGKVCTSINLCPK